MGFDVYGLNPINPNNLIRPEYPGWIDMESGGKPKKLTEKERDKWIEDTDKYEEAVPGHYFRNNVWWWRPLWEFVCETCDHVLTEEDMEMGMENSGHEINKAKAEEIAKTLKKHLSDQSANLYQANRDAEIESLPFVDCDICDGTGYRKPPPESGAGHKDCNGCNSQYKDPNVPVGKRLMWAANYAFDVENVANFATFCENSGGFEIC